MTPPPRAPDVPGYEVLGLLGTGGLGAVWRARDRAGAMVALKVVEPRRAVDAATAERLFRREALASMNLDHPGIVKALDAVRARDGRPCIVFELAEGPTLRDAVKERGPLPAEEVIALGRATADALDHAHRHGVVHGDLSPGNVLLAPGGARLLDFGLVRELEGDAGGGVFATPGYTAPEVIAGGAPTAASDLHALGRTLAFAILGRTPDAKGDLSIPDAPDGLRAVIERLGRTDPAARYRSAAELRLDLDAVRAGEKPLGASLAGARARMAARRPGPWIVAACAVAAMAGWALLRDGGPAPAPSPTPSPSPTPTLPPVAAPWIGKVEALRVLLGRDPIDFGAARALAAEIRKAGGDDPVLADLDAKWRAAASALADRKKTEAQTALSAGDRGAWKKVLLEWPAEFADAPEATEMLAQWQRWDAAATVMAAQMEKVLAGVETALAPKDPAAPAAPPLDLVALDADLARMQEDPATPPDLRRRAGALRAKAGALRDEDEKSARAAVLKKAIETFLVAAAKPEPKVTVRARLFDAIAAAEGLPLQADLVEIRDGADKAHVALERALARVVGKPWGGIVEEKYWWGIPDRAPDPDRTFVSDFVQYDVAALVPDAGWAGAWLLTRGWVEAAMETAPKSGAVVRVLAASGLAKLPSRRHLLTYFTLLRTSLGHEPLRSERPPGTLPRENPAKAHAVDAYVGNDLVKAMELATEAIKVDPYDAELIVLWSRITLGLSEPLPTVTARCMALRAARDAWGHDLTLAAAPALVAEISQGLHEDLRSQTNMFLAGVVMGKQACIALGRASPQDLVSIAERFHRAGDVDGATRVLSAAKKLGAPMPAWAPPNLD